MSIYEKILGDIQVCRKNNDKKKMLLLQTVIGECDRSGKGDDIVVATIKKMIGNAKTLENHYEVEVLNGYMPTILSGDNLKEEITVLLANAIDFQIGDVMRHLKTRYGNAVDMREASVITKALLG